MEVYSTQVYIIIYIPEVYSTQVYIHNYLCRHAWADLKHRHALYRSKIPAASAISISYERYIRNRFKPVFRAIKPEISCRQITYVTSAVRYVSGINHSTLGRCAPSSLMIYSSNVPHGCDITNTYIPSGGL